MTRARSPLSPPVALSCQPTRRKFYLDVCGAVGLGRAGRGRRHGDTIRPVRTPHVPVIRKPIDSNVESGGCWARPSPPSMRTCRSSAWPSFPGATVGDCGALHVMWEDLAEIRTVAVRDDCQGIGHAIVDALLRHARAVGVSRVFCLTFAVDFFRGHGFQPISGTPVAAEVYRELLRSYDEAWRSFSTWSG